MSMDGCVIKSIPVPEGIISIPVEGIMLPGIIEEFPQWVPSHGTGTIQDENAPGRANASLSRVPLNWKHKVPVLGKRSRCTYVAVLVINFSMATATYNAVDYYCSAVAGRPALIDVDVLKNLDLDELDMFLLAEMKDVIRVTPEHFHQSLTDSITVLLNRKLANKVVLNVGLCIALYDITDIGHSYIFPGDGSSHTEVKFRYMVFRPVVEEIVVGKIKITLGFFDDILIPVNALQHPSRFDETDQAWVWEFRVTSEAFEESLPAGPPGSDCTVQTVAPYRIVGGINEPGLGLLTWWEVPGQDGDEDDE
ncbi:DNA-directed RNA polymerase III 25 kDa polypeptide [Operophtera brumata]|uniref:DNA-directed RNA polymerase III 25 kDa polypeptide n=1 Tax=Operophtera brumata TaxID=104452 RepID=A0A0L7LRM7_OPEBR|nr:DNA-directed RNA polymerase III 25 kDa polypeptide [Operophtera brumata]